MDTVSSFELQGFQCHWMNSITKIGYVQIEYDSAKNEFSSMYVLADKIADFIRNKKELLPVQFDFHYFEPPDQIPTLSVIPRFSGDYEDHNYVYTLSEQKEKPKTAQNEVVQKLADELLTTIK